MSLKMSLYYNESCFHGYCLLSCLKFCCHLLIIYQLFTGQLISQHQTNSILYQALYQGLIKRLGDCSVSPMRPYCHSCINSAIKDKTSFTWFLLFSLFHVNGKMNDASDMSLSFTKVFVHMFPYYVINVLIDRGLKVWGRFRISKT